MMPDREKLIRAWEIFRDSNPYQICSGREFRALKEPGYCMGQMIEDTITLLSRQEPILCKDCKEYNECAIQFKFADPDNPGEWFCAYGKRKQSGQAVKWE